MSGNTCTPPIYQPPVYPPPPNYPPPVYYPPVYQPPYYHTVSYVPPQPIFYAPPQYPPVRITSPAPYITLSAVPYTGLDLGPMGEVAYWSLLALTALLGLYLTLVRRTHHTLARWMQSKVAGVRFS